MRDPDRMKVARKMQVDVFHRHNLRITAAAAPPLTPKQGPRLGSRRQMMVCLPTRFNASPRPTVVVVFPSPQR
jgi:hypothetical protein